MICIDTYRCVQIESKVEEDYLMSGRKVVKYKGFLQESNITKLKMYPGIRLP